jgi:hypothetical protein
MQTISDPPSPNNDGEWIKNDRFQLDPNACDDSLVRSDRQDDGFATFNKMNGASPEVVANPAQRFGYDSIGIFPCPIS